MKAPRPAISREFKENSRAFDKSRMAASTIFSLLSPRIGLATSVMLSLLFFAQDSSAQTLDKFYYVQQIEQAKAQAQKLHQPIAWISSGLVYLNANHDLDRAGSEAELTALALRTLQGRAVIIFQDADNDLSRIPGNMAERIEVKDEGDIPGGYHIPRRKLFMSIHR